MDTPVTEKPHTDEQRRVKFFSLKTPYMQQGRVTPIVAKTDNLTIQVKVNAEGGENAIHTHLDEDHGFIVLEGQVSIFDELGNETKLQQHQGVVIPKGAYYRYLNTGSGNLVLLRVSAPIAGAARAEKQGSVFLDGTQKSAGPKNKTLPPIVMPGKFFAAAAGFESEPNENSSAKR